MNNLDNYNPFIHDAATNLSEEIISELYIDIEDSEMIESQRNVFVTGYRGSGKSMLLRHNTFSMRYSRNKHLDFIGIYVSCMTPFFSQKEHLLVDDNFQKKIVDEHMLVLVMAINLIKSIKNDLLSLDDESKIIQELKYYFDIDSSSLDDFYRFLNKELFNTQKETNNSPETFYKNAYTFSSLIFPIIEALSSIDKLFNTRFTFLIDDGQLLSDFQKRSLNSWISFRDTRKINFKVAITSTKEYAFYTDTNSVILDNHDYVVVDLEKNFFGKESNYYEFAKKIIEKRLDRFGLNNNKAEDFFPEDVNFKKKIDEIKENFIQGIYPELKDKTEEERKTRASKYTRAIYFSERLKVSKANNPTIAYTGFNTLVNISTGVIRNLLIPCSTMYEYEKIKSGIDKVEYILPKTQYEAILNESQKKWESLKYLSVQIEGCDEETSLKIEKFLKNFGNKLKSLLLDPSSTEKQVLTFTIEKLDDYHNKNNIKQILLIAEKAGLLYSRIGPGRNSNRTTWYTPNRILWTDLGLDPVGQNGRINIRPEDFEYMTEKEIDYTKNQKGLFDELL
ncbi:ORC-CDC6 family AAA ATPase [Aliarcobacter lanthieri]|uniref:ORC-CDC6 family AAA ATPase n=1 Tax=Aliarcobacter lanthieri TaxID=1355374 RepID=UPI00047D55F3|nr:hypothetical protein [Aliarcobacter lanthieri]